jgi:hypothetical protein
MVRMGEQAAAKAKYRDSSPFDFAQGQDDDVRRVGFGSGWMEYLGFADLARIEVWRKRSAGRGCYVESKISGRRFWTFMLRTSRFMG